MHSKSASRASNGTRKTRNTCVAHSISTAFPAPPSWRPKSLGLNRVQLSFSGRTTLISTSYSAKQSTMRGCRTSPKYKKELTSNSVMSHNSIAITPCWEIGRVKHWKITSHKSRILSSWHRRNLILTKYSSSTLSRLGSKNNWQRNYSIFTGTNASFLPSTKKVRPFSQSRNGDRLLATEISIATLLRVKWRSPPRCTGLLLTASWTERLKER